MDSEVKRIKELRETLTHHAKLYYVYDAPEISDYEYDMMFAELKALEEKHPELEDPTSPTHRVGGKALDKFEKVTHSVRMNSLSDVFSFEEVEDFIVKTDEIVGEAEYSVEPKIDGLSVALTYENGVLVIKAKQKIRLLPALNIEMELLKKAVKIIKEACAI